MLCLGTSQPPGAEAEPRGPLQRAVLEPATRQPVATTSAPLTSGLRLRMW